MKAVETMLCDTNQKIKIPEDIKMHDHGKGCFV